MEVTKNITVIPARRRVGNTVNKEEKPKLKVAAYCRVSTDSDEQATSYEAQVDFYTRYINNNPEWEFVAVYTDEGISGTNTKKRDGFNRMVADALSGKIDLILTKSISRFARNTRDLLELVERLEEAGEITVIRPQRPVEVNRIEQDVRKLTELYEEGYRCAEQFAFE